jgi:CubicO group peptidase (beta-lactamase class C family)
MQALEAVRRWPVEVAAVGVQTFPPAGRPTGPGVAPVPPAIRATVGPTDRVLPWASVTKPVTALAVLVAVEEGTLALDTPAGPSGSTVAHLLAHTSGLAPDRPEAVTSPGDRRIYSNAGYQVLAELLAGRSGLPFEEYVVEGVLTPLGMGGASFAADGDRGAGAAAAGLEGTLDDLLRLAAEWSAPTLISPATHAQARRTAFPGLAGVLPGIGRFDPCDWGLGVEVKGTKAPHWSGSATSPATYGHFGRSGSFVWVDPEVGLACVGLADRPFGPWALRAWPELADAVRAEVAGGTARPGHHV